MESFRDTSPGSESRQGQSGRHRPITPSEIEILDLLAEKPLLSGKQIAEIRTSAAPRTWRLIAHLQNRGLLLGALVPGQIDVPANRYYYLSDGAIRMLAKRDVISPGRFARKHWLSASRLTSLFNALDHTRNSRQFFIDLVNIARRRGEALETWHDEAAAARLYGWHGEVKLLRPDGFGCYRQRGRALAFYLEWDSGNSGFTRHWRKLRAYQQCFASLGGRVLRPILMVTVRSRLRPLNRAAYEIQRRFGTDLPLLIALNDELEASGAFGCRWWDVRYQQEFTLESAPELWLGRTPVRLPDD